MPGFEQQQQLGNVSLAVPRHTVCLQLADKDKLGRKAVRARSTQRAISNAGAAEQQYASGRQSACSSRCVPSCRCSSPCRVDDSMHPGMLTCKQASAAKGGGICFPATAQFAFFRSAEEAVHVLVCSCHLRQPAAQHIMEASVPVSLVAWRAQHLSIEAAQSHSKQALSCHGSVRVSCCRLHTQ
jgi:hypothetical protein